MKRKIILISIILLLVIGIVTAAIYNSREEAVTQKIAILAAESAALKNINSDITITSDVECIVTESLNSSCSVNYRYVLQEQEYDGTLFVDENQKKEDIYAKIKAIVTEIIKNSYDSQEVKYIAIRTKGDSIKIEG